MAIDTAIGLTWLVFWIYWLTAATRSKPSRRANPTGIAVRLTVFVVAVLLVRLGAFHSGSLSGSSLAIQVAGLLFFLAGLALAVYARLHIGRNWGTPMSEKEDPELISTGPYRWIRHPIYSGIILAMLGTALAVSPAWLVLVALLGASFVYSAFVEERIMTARFPTAYPKYRASSRMFIPGVF